MLPGGDHMLPGGDQVKCFGVAGMAEKCRGAAGMARKVFLCCSNDEISVWA